MKIKVWDGFIRGFHWLLVLTFAGLWYTGGDIMQIDRHEQLGIFLLSLLLTRTIWGFVGSESAQFRYFIKGPKSVFLYLANPKQHQLASHNPIGAWSAVLLLVLLFVQVITGLFSDDAIFYRGPLASLVSTNTASSMTSLHHLNFNLLTVFVGLHVLAIFIYKLVGEPLVYAMIQGEKAGSAEQQPRLVHGAWGYLLLAVIYAAVTFSLPFLARYSGL